MFDLKFDPFILYVQKVLFNLLTILTFIQFRKQKISESFFLEIYLTLFVWPTIFYPFILYVKEVLFNLINLLTLVQFRKQKISESFSPEIYLILFDLQFLTPLYCMYKKSCSISCSILTLTFEQEWKEQKFFSLNKFNSDCLTYNF